MWLEGVVGAGAGGLVQVGLLRMGCRTVLLGTSGRCLQGLLGAGRHCHPILQIRTLKLLKGSHSPSTGVELRPLAPHAPPSRLVLARLCAFTQAGPSPQIDSWTVCLLISQGSARTPRFHCRGHGLDPWLGN